MVQVTTTKVNQSIQISFNIKRGEERRRRRSDTFLSKYLKENFEIELWKIKAIDDCNNEFTLKVFHVFHLTISLQIISAHKQWVLHFNLCLYSFCINIKISWTVKNGRNKYWLFNKQTIFHDFFSLLSSVLFSGGNAAMLYYRSLSWQKKKKEMHNAHNDFIVSLTRWYNNSWRNFSWNYGQRWNH